MNHAALYARLARVAKARKTILYTELGAMADVSLDADDDVKSLGFILDAVADQERAVGMSCEVRGGVLVAECDELFLSVSRAAPGW